MKARLLALFLLASLPAFGQTDRELVLQAQEKTTAQDTSSHNKLYHLFRDQLRGQCYYDPECVEFYPQAVRQLGFLRGTLSMLDRMMRDTYIGTATFPRELKTKDGRIHEGPEAYRRRRQSKK